VSRGEICVAHAYNKGWWSSSSPTVRISTPAVTSLPVKVCLLQRHVHLPGDIEAIYKAAGAPIA